MPASRRPCAARRCAAPWATPPPVTSTASSIAAAWSGTTLAALVAANLVWPLFLVAPANAGTAAVRLLNPFGQLQWPRQTQIVLDKPRSPAGVTELNIGRNEMFEVRGRAHGAIPDHARVLFFFDHFEPEDRRLELIKEGDRAGVFATRIEPGRIQRSFRFQVLAGDNETEQYLVNVLPPPDLDLLNGKPSPQLRLHFPAYTDLPSPRRKRRATATSRPFSAPSSSSAPPPIARCARPGSSTCPSSP